MGNTFIGEVTRPDFDAGDKKVKLTATVTKGLVTKTISFDTIVKKLGITDGQAVVKDIASILLPAETKKNLILPLLGSNGSKISWSSDTPASISNTGLIVRPEVGSPAVTVKLTATVTRGIETQNKEFTIKVLSWTTDDELEDAKAKITWNTISGLNTSINSVVSDLVFPAIVGRDVAATWITSNKSFCTEAGKITRPTYTQGPVIINVTATLTKSGKNITVTISGIRLEPSAITNAEIALDTINKLDSSMFIGSNESLAKITSDMSLPSSVGGQVSEYSSITWSLVTEEDAPTTSQYITLTQKGIATECKITRPTLEQGNFATYLKATATANDPNSGESGTATKKFRIIVLAKES